LGPKLYNVVRLYKDGVEDGHLEAALDKYVTTDLVQHTPGLAGGRDGLAAALGPLLTRYRDRRVHPLRGFEDGSRVVLHSYQSYGGRQLERVVVDVFDTDDADQLTEHWSAAVPLCPSRSGYSQLDGPTAAGDPARTTAAKRLVRSYVQRCLLAGRPELSAGYLHPTDFAQHDPDVPGGAAGLRWYLDQPGARRLVRLDQVLGCGDLVATTGRYADPTGRYLGCDLYRVRDGRILDAWSAHQLLR